VLQTLSILIQNLRTQQTVYYLFSNNHINDIVSMRFDFEDDEVLVGGWVFSIVWCCTGGYFSVHWPPRRNLLLALTDTLPRCLHPTPLRATGFCHSLCRATM
jgi:hypothetical protein